jgi:hypothetical protein
MGTPRPKTKGGEGMVESLLVLTMPVWLPLKAIQMMIKEIQAEKKKKRDEEGE